MPKTSQYLPMGDLTGTERLLGVQGADTEVVTVARVAEYAAVAAGAVTLGAVESLISTKVDTADLLVEAARIDAVEDDVAAAETAAATLAGRVTTLEAGQSSGVLGYATRALLFADLAHLEGTLAFVTNDATPAFNGTYIKSGGSGSGSWTQSADVTTELVTRMAAAEADIAALEADVLTAEADIAELQESTAALPSLETRVSTLESASPATFGTVSTQASAGAASALPATPAGYTQVTIAGQPYVIPYFAQPTPLQGPFDAFYSASFTLNSGTTYLSRPTQGRPSSKSTGFANASYVDSRFSTRVQRVTDITDAQNTLVYMRHYYSRRNPFNCDSTKRYAQGSNGYIYLYDVATNTRLDGGCTISAGLGAMGQGGQYNLSGTREVLWHPTDPNKIWHTQASSGDVIWREFDIVTKLSTVLFTINATTLAGLGLAGVTKTTMTGEGRPSDDGRYWCLKAMAGSTYRGFFCYDKETNTILGAVAGTYQPNWVGMSPSGTYALVAWSDSAGNANGNNGLTRAQCAAATINNANGLRAYNRALTTFTQISDVSSHADVGYATDGTEVYVAVCHSVGKIPGVAQGDVYMAALSSGAVWPLMSVYDGESHNIHISCTARNKPGYALVTLHGDGTAGGVSTYDESINILELSKSGSPDIWRVAHHQCRPGLSYWSEMHGVWNDDGNMILWASNYGDGADRIENYMIGLPTGSYG